MKEYWREIRASTVSYATLKLAKNSFTAGAVTGRRARFELLSRKWKRVKGTTGSDVTYEYAFKYILQLIRRIKFLLSHKKVRLHSNTYRFNPPPSPFVPYIHRRKLYYLQVVELLLCWVNNSYLEKKK